jgi:PEP-CTERM motif
LYSHTAIIWSVRNGKSFLFNTGDWQWTCQYNGRWVVSRPLNSATIKRRAWEMRKLMLNRAAYLGLICAALALLASASPVKADTIFTTGGTPPTFTSSSGLLTNVGASALAESFVATESATLTDAILPLQIPDDPPGDVAMVFIESSGAGMPSGTILDTLTTTGTITPSGHNLTFTCAVCSTLFAGTTYYIVLQQTAGGDALQWDNTNPPVSGSIFLANPSSPSATSTSWTPSSDSSVPAFEVDGTSVAEPSSLLLLGAGLLALAVIGRKKFAANGLAQS